ncbi:hypothetical protein [Parvularcula lutaonensis]|uniref:Uncharacterized protein n=1 Tax=Parvularcula lutaonensis TaxID=491923 RepID=A0ABV7ME69_9PROT|nr:hypothetical protein [Parvularcula lutaonensis]GGY54757.1 hypothetical protein GCM10007148_25600 [Parvularcula lutaonensis]
MSDEQHPDILPEERSIFETPGWIRFMWFFVPGTGLFFALMNIVLAVLHKTHPHFGWLFDKNPVFYGIVGFVSFSFIVLVGQHLRKIVMRPEDYYDGPEATMPRINTDDEVRMRSISLGETDE